METASERKRQSILRVELEWIQRGARARSTKQKARIQRYEELRDRENPAQDSQMELSSISTRMGKTTVELENMSQKEIINILFLPSFSMAKKITDISGRGVGRMLSVRFCF